MIDLEEVWAWLGDGRGNTVIVVVLMGYIEDTFFVLDMVMTNE